MGDPRKAALQNAAQAMAALRTVPLTDAAVHATRKALKRVRADLRLLRTAVGEPAYARENRALRDAARPLAAARDAFVLSQTAAGLLRGERSVAIREALKELRQAALRERDRALKRAAKRAPELARRVEESAARIGAWKLPADPRPSVAAGLKRVYVRGRKATREAADRRDTHALHESRKDVKYLAQALAVLEPLAAERIGPIREEADLAARDLGEEHDLALLAERLPALAVEDPRISALGARVARRREKLQAAALARAARIYRGKARKFLIRISMLAS